MMKTMNRVCLIAVAATLVAGCAKTREQNGYARHPELKSGQSARGSNRKQEVPAAPRILPETNYAAGRIFEQQGSPEKAIEQYRKAIALNHEYTAAYARLGLMLSVTGQHEESVAAFTKAVELKPGSAILRNNLGFELLYLERWAEAERHLREAGRLDPRLAQAHINLGLLLGRTQRDEQAVESFRMILPEPDAYYNLGLLQRAQGRHTQAAESFRHVLTINPEFNAAQRQLVQVERKVVAAEPAGTAVTTQDPIAADPGTLTAPAGAATSGHPVLPQTTSVPFVDLGALIEELNPVPQIPINPVTAGPETLTPPIAIEDAAAEKEIPTTRTTIGASMEPSEPTENRIQGEPAIIAPPAEPVTVAQETQPLRWYLPLSDMAHALNLADHQRFVLPDVQAFPAEPVPTQPSIEENLALLMGPPAPSSDEVTVVLGTAETKLPEPQAELVDSIPALSAHGQETLKTMDEMEISLQIIRNEIQCQKDGAGDAKTANPENSVLPAHFTPTEQHMTSPDQRTQNWRTDFEALDHVLATVGGEGPCTQNSVLVNNAAPSPGDTVPVEAAMGDQSGHHALQAPPTTTPRRVRSGSRKSIRK
jgi:tetratricopeptide (TPR) repeat protein